MYNMKFDSSSSSEDEDSEKDDCPTERMTRKVSKKNRAADVISTNSSDENYYLQPMMWLGTEDGCIHVYNCTDNIRIKKNKIKLQHCSSIQCIMFVLKILDFKKIYTRPK